MTDAVAPRRRFVKRWLIAAGIGVVSLLVILAGVYLLAEDAEPLCSCSPIPSSTAEPSLGPTPRS